METVEADFEAEFVARMVEKLEYQALVDTVSSVRARPAELTCAVRTPSQGRSHGSAACAAQH